MGTHVKSENQNKQFIFFVKSDLSQNAEKNSS